MELWFWIEWLTARAFYSDLRKNPTLQQWNENLWLSSLKFQLIIEPKLQSNFVNEAPSSSGRQSKYLFEKNTSSGD